MESLDISKVADDLLALSREEDAGFEFEKRTHYGNGYPQIKQQFLNVLEETDNPHLPHTLPASVFVRELSQFGENPVITADATKIADFIMERM